MRLGTGDIFTFSAQPLFAADICLGSANRVNALYLEMCFVIITIIRQISNYNIQIMLRFHSIYLNLLPIESSSVKISAQRPSFYVQAQKYISAHQSFTAGHFDFSSDSIMFITISMSAHENKQKKQTKSNQVYTRSLPPLFCICIPMRLCLEN